MFVRMLEYKAQNGGKHVIKADKLFPSSQKCHVCGALNPKTKDLSIRKWVCPVCGSKHNRDHNAAINLKKEAQRLALM